MLEERWKQAPKDLWLLECIVGSVDGCIDTRGLVAVPILFCDLHISVE